MKKLIYLLLFVAMAATANAQISFTLTTAPCHNDGVLTANFTGMTPPLTVSWSTSGISGTTITHTGVSGSSDALTSYSGGPVSIMVTDATSAVNYNYYTGAPPFTYMITTTTAYCPALGTATATVTGGTSPYTYNWFSIPGMSTVGTTNPVSLPAGGYGLTITDAAGCTYGSLVTFDSAYIYGVAPFTVTVNTTPANCTNGTAAVGPLSGGTTPYSFSWSTGATSSSIGSLIQGYYTVTVTDAAGCSAMGWASVPQAVSITVPVTPTPATCLASDGAVIAFPAGGVPPYTYVWSNTVTTQSQSGLSAGYYSVVATDANGCFGNGGGNVIASTPITATYTATTSLCTSNTGSATLTVSGGTTPYTINWFTTPPQTGTTATTLGPGTHSFKITDAAGCIRTGSAVVPPINTISATFSATSALCATATGGLSVTPAGGTTPYTYSWAIGGTSSSISSVAGGWYAVTVTDAMGCHVTKSGEVPISSPMGVGVSTTAASCIFTHDGIATATPFGGTTPYTYYWYGTGTGTTSTITSLEKGDYWVDVTDAVGCHKTVHSYVPYNVSATSCYCTISGIVYHDVNNNCTQDPGEPGIPNIQIYCSGIGYTYTDVTGHYSFKVPSGSYTITETIRAFYPLSTCQLNNIPVTATATSGCVIPVDFANQINPLHDIHVRTWNFNLAIPGHTYTQQCIISNEGTVSESSILAGYRTDGQLFAPSFAPGGIFSGTPYWYSSGTSFPTLAPGASQSILMNYGVPTSIPLGTSVVFKDTGVYTSPMSGWTSDYYPADNVNYFTTNIVSSYDPNFKEVSPKGAGPTGIISVKDTILEYMVHFQNTGTYQAENIVVVDTLDNNVDWKTLKPIYMSANCRVDLKQSGSYKIATFTFNNINLPPAQSQPVASNGMFTYTIHTKTGLAVGSTIKNNASIYFDYNEPIKTNTTLNTIGDPTAVNNVDPVAYNSFTIFPNPTSRSFNAVINSDDMTTANMMVTDITGKTLISQTLTLQKGEQTIATDVSQLAPGMYLVSYHANGKTQTQKLVIMK